MSDTQTVTTTDSTPATTETPAGTLVTTVPMEETASWPVAAHLSPAAAFQTDRVGICTSYQLAAVDHTPAAAHLEAALQHARAAADAAGPKDDRARMITALRLIHTELYRAGRKVGFNQTL